MAATQKLIISRAEHDLIAAEAEQHAPLEACGLVFGTRAGSVCAVSHIQPMQNVAADPAKAFEIAPQDIFNAHRKARVQEIEILGHYHSHPNGLPKPSRYDMAAISDVYAIWLIQPLEMGRARALQAYAIAAETLIFYSLELEIISR